MKRQIVFERKRFATRQIATREFLNNVDARAFEDHVTQHLIFELEAHILGRTRGQHTIVAREYASLWQHIKDVFFPHSSAKLGRPVRYRTHEYHVECWELYPEANVALPPEMGRAVFTAFVWDQEAR